jgi:hypothetical protein
MRGKVYSTINFTGFTFLVDGLSNGVGFEGMRLAHIYGQPYFIEAGYTRLQFRNLDGTFAGTVPVPASLGTINYPPHGAITTKIGNYYYWVAFESGFAYGNQYLYSRTTHIYRFQ